MDTISNLYHFQHPYVHNFASLDFEDMFQEHVMMFMPKRSAAEKVIPVPPNLRNIAIMLRTTTDTYIWESPKDIQPCNPSHFRKKFKEAIASVDGVRVLTPHSCRHTYVSQMQALGVDLQTIQSIVGHADIDMTQHYLHVQDSIRKSAVEKFSEAFPL